MGSSGANCKQLQVISPLRIKTKDLEVGWNQVGPPPITACVLTINATNGACPV